ncbi:MAG: ankyrin repeat domain-containing protein [Pseudomonadota bacterium]
MEKIFDLRVKIIKNIVSLISIFALLMTLSSCATMTPLGIAAKKGDIKKVEALLNKGADANGVWLPGLSPLHEAVFNNASLDIIRLLIDKGADVNKQSCGDGWAPECNCTRPLNIAACKGNINVVKLLIDRGAEIDAGDMGGYTPLAQAASAGQSAAVRLLIENGADTDNTKGFLISRQADSAVRVIEMSEKNIGNKKVPISLHKEILSTVVKSDVDELPLFKVQKNKNAYAIVIGIENYRKELPKADFASHDARLVTDYLIKTMGYPEENVITLLNDRALKSDFEKYFEKWLSNNVEKDSTVFIYYSGHGAPEPQSGNAYLVPYDGDPSFLGQTGYSLKRMYDALGKLPAKEIIVALDSCFSGAGGRSVLAKGARPLVMNLQNDTLPSKNMTVLSASAGDQISSTYDDKGHGLFTYFLLKGIKNEDVINPDGSIKMDDLFGYIKPQVERIARKQFNNEQTPQLLGAKKN